MDPEVLRLNIFINCRSSARWLLVVQRVFQVSRMLRMTETSLGWHQVGCSKCADQRWRLAYLANDLSPNEVCVRGTWSFPLSADFIPGLPMRPSEQGIRKGLRPIYRAMHFSAERGLAFACRLSVCLSVCPSVTLVICDHIGWKFWKLTAQSISPTPSLIAAKRRSTYSHGTLGNFCETRGGVGEKWHAGE